MNLFPFLATFVFAVCLNVEGFSLKCSSKNPSVREYFARESQKVTERIGELWDCNQHSSRSFSAFIMNIGLDVLYARCLIRLGSNRFESPSEFRWTVKKCSVLVCERAKSELDNANALNEVNEEVVRVEVTGFNDPDPSFDEEKEDEEISAIVTASMQQPQESIAVPEKTRVMVKSSETVDVQKVALILLVVGLVFTIIFMALRALYPLRNRLLFGNDEAEPVSEQSKDVGKEVEGMTEETKGFNPPETQTYFTNANNASPNGGYSFSAAPPAYRK